MTQRLETMSGALAPVASVVVAVYNGGEQLGAQVAALLGQSLSNLEVILADNGSSDGCVEPFVGIGKIRVVDASGKRGQGFARNVGAAVARSDYLLFCDQDDVAEPGWAEALVEALLRYDLVGGSFDVGSLNSGVEFWRTPPVRADVGSPLPFASGSNFGIRREVLNAVGGWPERYLGGGEDTALCWRAQLAGYTLGYAPRAVMQYRYRRGFGAHVKQQFHYGRQAAVVSRDFAELDDMPVAPIMRTLGWLAVNVGLLAKPESRGGWMGVAARRAGYEVGRRSARSIVGLATQRSRRREPR
ncbi:glycosyltransferase [Acidimicrobiaceae bacterium USS-CC1]|uniref:Glycosyltransferase n=1 Tax=Acidiferrimicrobium australe TaxID=2664430 RepID=A0ABW9QVH1_9ACTN|nr:glycosyltransferase [Acidiferrimicrobium australe]